MANKIQIKRGMAADMPALDVAEFGLAVDTGQLYIGTSSGNVLINGGGDGGGIETVTTAGTGSAFTATLTNAPAALTAGLTLIIVPHVASTSSSATLNVNGLGAKYFRYRRGANTNTLVSPTAVAFLTKSKPVTVMYDGAYWIITDAQPALSIAWSSVTGKPTTFTPASHYGSQYGQAGKNDISHVKLSDEPTAYQRSETYDYDDNGNYYSSYTDNDGNYYSLEKGVAATPYAVYKVKEIAEDAAARATAAQSSIASILSRLSALESGAGGSESGGSTPDYDDTVEFGMRWNSMDPVIERVVKLSDGTMKVGSETGLTFSINSDGSFNSSFSSMPIWGDMRRIVVYGAPDDASTPQQITLVQIPKYYIKEETAEDGFKYKWVCKQKKDGYRCANIFLKESMAEETDYYYIGAYPMQKNSVSQQYDGVTRYASAAGYKYNTTDTADSETYIEGSYELQGAAQIKLDPTGGINYSYSFGVTSIAEVLDFYLTLMPIEFGTRDLLGVVAGVLPAQTGDFSTKFNTGVCDNVASLHGVVIVNDGTSASRTFRNQTGVNSGFNPFVWHGIENPYGIIDYMVQDIYSRYSGYSNQAELIFTNRGNTFPSNIGSGGTINLNDTYLTTAVQDPSGDDTSTGRSPHLLADFTFSPTQTMPPNRAYSLNMIRTDGSIPGGFALNMITAPLMLNYDGVSEPTYDWSLDVFDFTWGGPYGLMFMGERTDSSYGFKSDRPCGFRIAFRGNLTNAIITQ